MNEAALTTSTVKSRAVVAMSGGVDSSVVAAMLHDDGLDVVGISMRLYGTSDGLVGKSCCSPDDLFDARQVAAQRGFPFYVANYQDEFRERVIEYFVDEYRRGRTPSPCILCNDHLKFDTLLSRMMALGGEFLATGHYARVVERDGRFALLRGADRAKDQSYFLFGLDRESLSRIRFPLGELTKDKVRKLAEGYGLVTAQKPESQDICFVGGENYSSFVEKRLSKEEIRPGRLVRQSTGEVLGEHGGIHRFTVGQRRGLGISYHEPLYVRGIDPDTADVYVGTKDELLENSFVVDRCNWLRWPEAPESFKSLVQVRYRHTAVPARVHRDPEFPDRVIVHLDDGERGISPGQAAVFYDGNEVLGGGWILRSGT